MKLRTLLVVPKYTNRPGDYYEFPLGLAYLSAALKKAGHEVECLNTNHYDSPAEQQVFDAIRQKDIHIVGTGGFSTHYQAVKRIFDAADHARKRIVKIAGGPLITSEPIIVAGGLGAHIGVVGEGEITIVEILDALCEGGDIPSIRGIVYRNADASYTATAPREFIADLDSVPLPDYKGFEIEKYLERQRPDDRQYLYRNDNPRFVYAVASRACPYKCTFCFPMFGTKTRARSLDNFFSEVDLLVNTYGVNTLGVFDALFDTSPGYVRDFSKGIAGYGIDWFMQIKAGSIDESRLTMLRDSGLFAILYGLESASDYILKKMKKGITVSDIENALALNRKLGVRIFGEFIFGHPAETWETAMQTLEWWDSNSHYQIDMAHLYPIPGCEDYRYCIENGIIPDPLDYIEKGCRQINMTAMDDATYRKIFDIINDYGTNRAAFGALESITAEGMDEDKGVHACTIRATCPHCGHTSAFRHYHLATIRKTIKYPYSGFTFTCLSCNQAYTIREDDIEAGCPDDQSAAAFRDRTGPL